MASGEKSGDREERLKAELAWWDPWDGPASENAYPESLGIEIDGKEVSMNSLSRTYNRLFGETDEAADIPWTPGTAGAPDSTDETQADVEEADGQTEEPGDCP